MGEPWHCQQIPNGDNPLVVCERESLTARVDAALLLHTPEQHPEGATFCSECDQGWPCRTYTVLATTTTEAHDG